MAKKQTGGAGGGRNKKSGSPRGGKFVPGSGGRTPRTLAFWLVLFLLFIVFYQLLGQFKVKPQEFSYSRLKSEVSQGNVAGVLIEGREVKGVLKEGDNRQFKSYIPFEDDPSLLGALESAGVEIEAKPTSINWLGVSLSWLPMLLFIGFWLFIMRQMQGGGNKVFTFGKSKAKLLSENRPKVTFDDVAGADEAKGELQEIIEFLKEPQKFRKLGGKIPKGALLLGPPGTGKTLLARAVAGEARVPFFSMSGSDFVEMFVGVGASRVRDLFDQGKKNAPCILFIDEIDAVGRHRGAGLGGGHDEREQTLNQLLVEMDGFESNEGVILIAATNRPDVLDPALLRPGRFDRQIVVDRPDIMGREGILKVHVKEIPLSKDVNLNVLARGTPGLSGADLANMVNEAALLAARRDQVKVRMVDFEDAKDKVMMGIERKSLIISDDEKKSTAYHESGHVLVSKMIPGTDPVHKVTIIPRGRALGLTQFLPMDERHTYTRDYCLGVLAKMLGGRAADEIVGSQPTTGAGDDIEKATHLARKMVCDWGMSEKLGPVTFGKKEEEIFLGREIAKHRDYSEKTAQIIDDEVKGLVQEAYEKAKGILEKNVKVLHRMAEALLEREILDNEEINRIIAGKKLAPLSKPKKAAAAKEKKKKAPARKTGTRPAVSPRTAGKVRNG